MAADGPVPLSAVIAAAVPAELPLTRGEWLRRIAAEQARRIRHRRARVLAHPDLAAQLCAPPLGYARPDQWNGYVPPEWDAEIIPEGLRSPAGRPNEKGRRTGVSVANDSLRRKALEAICREAERRAAEAGQPCAGDELPLAQAVPWPHGQQPLPVPDEQTTLDAWPAGSIGEQAQ